MTRLPLHEREAFQPVQMIDLDVGAAPATLHTGLGPDRQPYRRAQLLLRDGHHPLGVRVVDAPDGQVPAEVVRRTVAEVLAGAPRGLDRPLPPTWPASDDLPSVTVLVATRDRPSALARCLESLARVDYPRLAVLVVDNTLSGDEARGVVDHAARGGLDVRWMREPIPGLATAHNAALAALAGDIVAVTDDDVEVDPSWVHAIVDAFVLHPDAGMVTGLIYPARLDNEVQARVEGVGLGKGFIPRRFDLFEHRDAHPLFPLAVGECGSGANMAFRRTALQEIGGFDLALGAGSPSRGGDDLAAIHDVLLHGLAVVYQPAAIVRHHHPSDPASLGRQAFGYGCGLGAYLTRCAIEDPGGLRVLVRAVVPGLRRLLQQETVDRGVGAGRRRGHAARHLLGLLSGPVGYLRGRRRARRIAPHVGSLCPTTPGGAR